MLENMSGVQFEHFCKRLLDSIGFETQLTKASGDGGIDIIAYSNKALISGKYIIQCKRYIGSVGEPVIRDLYGVVMSENANKGVLITTGTFTNGAIQFASNKQIELIDGTKLADLCEQNAICINENENDILSEYPWYNSILEELKRYPNNYLKRSEFIDKLYIAYIEQKEKDLDLIWDDEVLYQEERKTNILKTTLESNFLFFNKIGSADGQIECLKTTNLFRQATIYLLDGNFKESLDCFFTFLRLKIFDDYVLNPDLDMLDDSEYVQAALINITTIFNMTGNSQLSLKFKEMYKKSFLLHERAIRERLNYAERDSYLWKFEHKKAEYLQKPVETFGFYVDLVKNRNQIGYEEDCHYCNEKIYIYNHYFSEDDNSIIHFDEEPNIKVINSKDEIVFMSDDFDTLMRISNEEINNNHHFVIKNYEIPKLK